MSSRSIDVADVLKHELAPFPTSLFRDDGQMRFTAKSKLKELLAIEASERLQSSPNAVVIDGCAVLWTITWPTNGTVFDFLQKVTHFVESKLKDSDVYMIFDRYNPYSIKSLTRIMRAGSHVTRKHQFTLHTPLPPQQVVLNVTENKLQVIDMLCKHLVEWRLSIKEAHKLVLTSKDYVPIEVTDGESKPRTDLYMEHEEADVIIVQQALRLATENVSDHIKVISDDTDVLVLLLHYYAESGIASKITMEPTSPRRTSIDVGATASKHTDICTNLLAAHALSGCDTVGSFHGIGKKKIVQKLKQGYTITSLGNLTSDLSDIIKEATSIIAACYSPKVKESMSDMRFLVWSTKMAKPRITSAPELKSLPPTNEAFHEHVKRAHLQCAIWKSAMDQRPPLLDPLQYGWSRDEASKALFPVTLPDNVPLAPPDILLMIRSGCSQEPLCSTLRCGCAAEKRSCSMFCGCAGDSNCASTGRPISPYIVYKFITLEGGDIFEPGLRQWYSHKGGLFTVEKKN